jgi:hypothetical protein
MAMGARLTPNRYPDLDQKAVNYRPGDIKETSRYGAGV